MHKSITLPSSGQGTLATLAGKAKLKPFRGLALESPYHQCLKPWDILAVRTVFCYAMGWDRDRIAQMTGRSVKDITAILNPQVPARFGSDLDGGDCSRGFQEHYREVVYGKVCYHLRWIYHNAAVAAEWEGAARFVPQLEAIGEWCLQTYEAAPKSPCCESRLVGPINFVAIEDYHLALRIPDPCPDRPKPFWVCVADFQKELFGAA